MNARHGLSGLAKAVQADHVGSPTGVRRFCHIVLRFIDHRWHDVLIRFLRIELQPELHRGIYKSLHSL